MTDFPIIYKPVHGFVLKSVNWFLYGRDLRHEKVKAVNYFCKKKTHHGCFINPKYLFAGVLG